MDSALRENRLASELTEVIPIEDPIHYAMRKESVSSTAQLERAMDAARAGDFETAEPLFADLAELRDKIRYFLDRPDERRRIAQRSDRHAAGRSRHGQRLGSPL